MRFCLISTQRHWGGGEALLLSIAQELQRAGHAINWIVRDSGAVLERLDAERQSVLHRLKKRGNNWHDWNSVVHHLRAWVPDVMLLNDTHAVPIAGAASWFCRSPRPLRLAYKHTIFPLRSKLKYNLLADQIICVSQAARATLLQGGMAAERCQVIYGGCHIPRVELDERSKMRDSLGLAADERLLLSVGSLLDCKGHADLLEAMPTLLRTYPNARLLIAGDGEQRAHLEAQIKRLGLDGQVRLLGYRPDAETLIAAADLIVHPSHAEGLSLVLIQAQMLEKAIVATAVGGAAEVLQSDAPEQCSSWIAQPHEPASLATCMLQALAAIESDITLSKRLAATAERTREQFNIRTNALQLADHCARLLGERR